MSDLQYAQVVGRFGITRGDGADGDEYPDTVYCDEGVVVFTPQIKTVKVIPDVGAPVTLVNNPIVAYIGTDGWVTYDGDPHVWLVDLGIEGSTNPFVPREQAAYSVQFQNVKCEGQAVTLPTFGFNPVAGEVNDLTLMAPLATGPGGQALLLGPQGVGIADAEVDGGGHLLLTKTDATVVDAGELPVGPGGSDAGVAGYITTPGTATEVALTATIASQASPRIYSLADLPETGINVPHRLGSYELPEGSRSALLATAGKYPIADCDVILTADGQLVISHDESTVRVFNGTGNVADYSLASFPQNDIGSKTLGSGWPLEDVLTFSEFVEHCRGKCAMIVDPKNAGVGGWGAALEEIDRVVAAAGMKSATLIGSQFVDCITASTGRGFATMGYSADASTATMDAQAAAGATWYALSLGATESQYNNARARFDKILMLADTRTTRDIATGYGVDGIIAERPVHLFGPTPLLRSTEGDVLTGKLSPGNKFYQYGTPVPLQKGKGYGGQKHVVKHGALSGGMSSSHTLRINFYVETAVTSSTEHIWDIFFGAPTEAYWNVVDAPLGAGGNQIFMRRNGQIVFNRVKADISGADTLATVSTPQPAVGVASQVDIIVTPTTIEVVRNGIAAATLSGSVAAGTVTSLPVNALAASISSGTQLLLPNGQRATLSATAAAAATSISVTSFTLTDALTAAQPLYITSGIVTDSLWRGDWLWTASNNVDGAAWMSKLTVI